ncbi:hypothetical protein [Capsulimonas corticalis]|uniref:hypothetical protein n=1 Tax=Capsulimonas corticalis TaxID=2219043 RepID=UPI000F64EBB5|nr:hypothetical protein [Capsulimonas corticalis]
MALQQHWDGVASNIPTDPYGIAASGHAYTIGAQVTPNMGAYWEVNLANIKNVDDLRQFNILLLNMRSNISFTLAEREMLRQYVDGGGQLLIENTGVDTTAVKNPFDIASDGPLFFKLQFTPGSYTVGVLPATPSGAFFRHPIISEPNFLSPTDLNSLGHSQDLAAADYGLVTSNINLPLDPTDTLSSVLLNAVNSTTPVVAAAQVGAGEVVVDTTASCNAINDFLGGYDSSNTIPQNAPNSGPFCTGDVGSNIATGPATLARAPIADLKFLVNVMSWTGIHNSEYGNSHQNSATTSALSAAVAPAWHYVSSNAISGYTPPAPPLYVAGSAGSAIYGHYLAVVDRGGVLHVFDLIPGEDLDADTKADDGDADYSLGAGYDEIWHTTGTGKPGLFSSSPTIAIPGPASAPVIYVEEKDGKVQSYDLASGLLGSAYTPSSGGKQYGDPATATKNIYAPAPTVYGNFLYAGQPDGSVMTVDFLNGGAQTQFAPQPNSLAPGYATGPEFVTAPPSVSLQWQYGLNGQSYNNDVVLYITTNRMVYSVFVGSYGELLTANGSDVVTKLFNNFPNSSMITSAPHAPTLYGLNTGYLSSASGGVSPQSFTSPTGAPYAPPFYADYLTSLTGAAGAGATRTAIALSDASNYQASTLTTYTSAPAIDKNGFAYLTVTNPDPNNKDSVIECIQDGVLPGNRSIRWRFRLPTSKDGAFTDSSGVDYSKLQDFNFIGAPVIDESGTVYALAADLTGTKAAVLSFDTNKAITANVFGANTPTGTVANFSVSQPIYNGQFQAYSEFGVTPIPLIQGVQFTGGGDGLLEFTNFGAIGAMGQGTLIPNLCEPAPIQVSYTRYDGTNNTPEGPVTVQLSSNMNWCILAGVASPVTAGLTLVGNYAFFGDTGGNLYRVSVHPSAASLSVAPYPKFVTTPLTALDIFGKKVLASVATGLTAADSIPVTGSGSIGLSGVVTSGGNTFPAISILQNVKTLVADSDRILELDADGDAIWSVDATTKATVAGGPFATVNPTGKVAIAHMDFKHPSDVSQLDSNTYLVADTGNNRCVEFDRAGKVIWELTRFQDPNGLLANTGQPDTLNQPTSIRAKRHYDATTGITNVHYLIADSGNSRIIEITDNFGPSGALSNNFPHNLTWVSHTYDVLGRQYRYVSADYFDGPDKGRYIVGLVSNKKISPYLPAQAVGPLKLGVQAPAAADAPGGSVVMLDYVDYATGALLPSSGYIHIDAESPTFPTNLRLRAYSSFNGYLLATGNDKGKFDIASAAADALANTGQNANSTFSFINPRYVKVVVDQIVVAGVATPRIHLLLADDDGAFDLRLQSPDAAHDGLLGFYKPYAQWGFTNVDYRAMQSPIDTSLATTFLRPARQFAASSIQLVGYDQGTIGGNQYTIGQYLLTSSTTDGDVGGENGLNNGPIPKIGGEVFTAKIGDYQAGNFYLSPSSTISRPTNSGPLVQPTSAVRSQ